MRGERGCAVKGWMLSGLLAIGLFVATAVGVMQLQGRLAWTGADPPPSAPSQDVAAAPPADRKPRASVRGEPISAATGASDFVQRLGAQRFEPGGLFDFARLDVGDAVDEIHTMLRSARSALDEAQRRSAALEVRERELEARQRDLADRERTIASRMLEVERERDKVDSRIREFERDVLLVRKSDAAGLRDYARMLAAFRPDRAASFIVEECADEVGRRRVVGALAMLDAEACAELLSELDPARVRELLVERLAVVQESRR